MLVTLFMVVPSILALVLFAYLAAGICIHIYSLYKSAIVKKELQVTR